MILRAMPLETEWEEHAALYEPISIKHMLLKWKLQHQYKKNNVYQLAAELKNSMLMIYYMYDSIVFRTLPTIKSH